MHPHIGQSRQKKNKFYAVLQSVVDSVCTSDVHVYFVQFQC